MKKIRWISILIIALMLLSSCSSVYVDLPVPQDTTALVNVDLDKEYFTEGYLRKEVSSHGGCIYRDSWIYVEHNSYDHYAGTSNGNDIYDTVQVLRIVKANAHTGQVTSICLDPICNHSPGSGCIAVAPEGATIALVQDVVGDWLMFQYSGRTEEFGLISESYVYNLKTGELLNIFDNEVGDVLMTRWASRCPVGNKLYGVKTTLDYTNTGYIPGENSQSEFDPETKSYLCVYDFDTRNTTELFEVPVGYRIAEVTNKRYIFSNDEKMYSIDHNGENLKEMDVLTFNPSAVCGQYAYGGDENCFYIYNVADNTLKKIESGGFEKSYSVTQAGIICTALSNYEEYLTFNLDYAAYAQAYLDEQKKLAGVENPTGEQLRKWLDEGHALALHQRDRALYKINSNLTLIKDFELEGEELPFAYFANCLVTMFHATDKYLYCGLNRGDPNNDYYKIEHSGSGFYMVELATGQLTEIPLLHLIVPPEAFKPED